MMDEPWVISSDPRNNTWSGYGLMASGIAWTAWVIVKMANDPAPADVPAAVKFIVFLPGALIFFSGIFSLVKDEQSTIIVDPAAREIVITTTSRFSEKTRTIPFDAVDRIDIRKESRRRTRIFPLRYLVLKLTNGKKYRLFNPDTREVVEGYKAKLLQYLGKEDKPRGFFS